MGEGAVKYEIVETPAFREWFQCVMRAVGGTQKLADTARLDEAVIERALGKNALPDQAAVSAILNGPGGKPLARLVA